MRYLLAFVLMMAAQAWAIGATGTLAADGDTTIVTGISRPHVHASGDFGGGTLTCYYDNGGSWVAIAGASFTAASDVTMDFERNITVKCTLSGSTAPALVWTIN